MQGPHTSALGLAAATDVLAWTECRVSLHGLAVDVRIRRLADRERERVAAALAWFAECLLDLDDGWDTTGWRACLQEILDECVEIRVHDRDEPALRAHFGELVCLGFDAFVRVNEIGVSCEALPVYGALN
jgi:hypothetical protein